MNRKGVLKSDLKGQKSYQIQSSQQQNLLTITNENELQVKGKNNQPNTTKNVSYMESIQQSVQNTQNLKMLQKTIMFNRFVIKKTSNKRLKNAGEMTLTPMLQIQQFQQDIYPSQTTKNPKQKQARDEIEFKYKSQSMTNINMNSKKNSVILNDSQKTQIISAYQKQITDNDSGSNSNNSEQEMSKAKQALANKNINDVSTDSNKDNQREIKFVTLKRAQTKSNLELSDITEEDMMTVSYKRKLENQDKEKEKDSENSYYDINQQIPQIRRDSEIKDQKVMVDSQIKMTSSQYKMQDEDGKSSQHENLENDLGNIVKTDQSFNLDESTGNFKNNQNQQQNQAEINNNNQKLIQAQNKRKLSRRRTTRIFLPLELESLLEDNLKITTINDQERQIRPQIKIKKDQNLLEVTLCQKDENGTIVPISEQKLDIKIHYKDNPKYNWKMNDVMIGAGVFGRVYQAFDIKSQREYALKIIEIKEYETDTFTDMVNEIFILNKLKNKSDSSYYVQLYDYYIIVDENSQEKKLVLVEELCQCSLSDIITFRREKKIEWREDELLAIFVHLLSALEKTQIHGVCHRDLKPQNILFSRDQMNFKLGDFGEGKFLNDQKDEILDEDEIKKALANAGKKRHTIRGTKLYMSPELKEAYQNAQWELNYSPFHSDLYSLGVTFLNMLAIPNKLTQQNIKHIMEEFKNIEQDHGLSVDIIRSLLQKNTEQRIQYQETKQKLTGLKVDLSEDAKIAVYIQDYKVEDKQTQAKIKLILAEGYQKLYKFSEALQIYDEFMKESSVQNCWLEEQAEALYNMGNIHKTFHQIADAKQCFQNSLKIRKSLFSELSVECGEIYNSLGSLSKDANEYENAIIYYQKSLNIYQDVSGENSAAVGDIYNNLGSLELQFGNNEKSRQYLEKSLAIIKNILGENSGQYHDILTNLAIVELNMQNYDRAKLLLLQTYQECQKLKGYNSPDLIIKLVNLAEIDIVENKLKQALERVQKAQWIAEKYYKKKSVQYVDVLNHLFQVYKQMKNYEKAQQIVKEAYELIIQIQSDHHQIIYIYSNQGELHTIEKDFQNAVKALKSAKDIYDKNPFDNKINAGICENLGIAYFQCQKFQECQYYFLEAKEIYLQNNNKNNIANLKQIDELLEQIRQTDNFQIQQQPEQISEQQQEGQFQILKNQNQINVI